MNNTENSRLSDAYVNGMKIKGQLIDTGAEGCIYQISRSKAAKIYSKYDPVKIAKVKALIALVNGLPKKSRRILCRFIAFPQAIVVGRYGKEIGFTMQKVSKKFDKHNNLFYSGNVKYKARINFLIDFAYVLNELHKNNIYVGDFNPKNFLSDKKGDFKMVDADSVDFYSGGRHYPCISYYPETVTNDLYDFLTKHYSTYLSHPGLRVFTEYTDDYSFAYIAFRLLFGASPFASVPAVPDERERARKNISPILTDCSGYRIPDYAVDKKYINKSMLGLFYRTFIKKEHVKAREYLFTFANLRENSSISKNKVKTYNGKNL